MDLMWRLLTKTFEWQKKLASLPSFFSVRKCLWSEHFHLSSTKNSRLREVAKMDFNRFSASAAALRKWISATRCACCLLSRFPDLNDLLFAASWKLRNFILTMKTPGEMHSFVECLSSDELYDCVYNSTNDRPPWLLFFPMYTCVFFPFINFLGGHSIWGLGLPVQKGSSNSSLCLTGVYQNDAYLTLRALSCDTTFGSDMLGDYFLYHLWLSCANEKGNLVYFREQLASSSDNIWCPFTSKFTQSSQRLTMRVNWV